MAEGITLDLDTAQFRKRIRTLTDKEVPRVLSQALNKVAFEIRDAERDESGDTFDFSGPGTRKFFSGKGAFRIHFSKPDTISASIFPAPKIKPILEQHHEGKRIRPGGKVERLAVDGRLAVPIGVNRGRRGRVRKNFAPNAILKEKRGFIRGNVLYTRSGKKRGERRIHAAYALLDSAQLDRVFDFYRVARDTARREFPRKFRHVLDKIR